MTKTILCVIGFAAFGSGIIDVVQAHAERKFGWALIWRGQMFIGSVLIGTTLIR